MALASAETLAQVEFTEKCSLLDRTLFILRRLDVDFEYSTEEARMDFTDYSAAPKD